MVYFVDGMDYEMKTNFWDMFTIADKFGEEAIRDTYTRIFDEWKSNIEYLTEFVMILNWKLWEHYEKKNEELATIYNELWMEADGYCCNNLEGDDLQYYMRTTD